MSQLLEQALNDIQPLTLALETEKAKQGRPPIKPVVLMPVLPSSAIDEILMLVAKWSGHGFKGGKGGNSGLSKGSLV